MRQLFFYSSLAKIEYIIADFIGVIYWILCFVPFLLVTTGIKRYNKNISFVKGEFLWLHI